jgi:F-type H+-transporting ATPase subunit delta
MLVSKAARRYATALLELAQEHDSVDQTLKDVLFIKRTLEDSRDLVLFLKSPIIKPDKKVAALEEIFGDHIGDLVHKFVTLIARKNRESVIDEIVTSFVELYNEYAGIISAELFVAQKLSDEQRARVTEKLEEVTGKKVNISTQVQPELKGGMAVKIADTVIDGTVKHKLEQLEDIFLHTATE